MASLPITTAAMQDTSTAPSSPMGLVASWRERAHYLRRYASAESAATAYEEAARELEESLNASANRLLSVAEAAQRAGRSPDSIRRAIGKQRLANAGRKHKPLVRAEDVEKAFPRRRVVNDRPSTYDAGADARFVLGRRGA